MDPKAPARRDRARAIVPDLIPEPADIDRTGPLDAREQRDLDRIHSARDNHLTAQWMRGKALESAFRRCLFRGEDGLRTRQEYLDHEWDGISESAAYREIGEWRLAKAISDACERPAPGSHVRALIDAAGGESAATVARWYAELRRHGASAGHRVTAPVVANLARYLMAGDQPPELEALFAPHRIPSAKPVKGGRDGGSTGEPITGVVIPGQESFPNLGMSGDDGTPAGDGAWPLSGDHIARLSAWIASEARETGIDPEHAADFLVRAITADGRSLRDWIADRATA